MLYDSSGQDVYTTLYDADIYTCACFSVFAQECWIEFHKNACYFLSRFRTNSVTEFRRAAPGDSWRHICHSECAQHPRHHIAAQEGWGEEVTSHLFLFTLQSFIVQLFVTRFPEQNAFFCVWIVCEVLYFGPVLGLYCFMSFVLHHLFSATHRGNPGFFSVW